MHSNILLWHCIVLCAASIIACIVATVPAMANTACLDGAVLEKTFDSGASWTACALIDEQHGFELRDIHYRAPGDTRRSIMRQLHLGQLLLHYHDDVAATALIGETGIGATSISPVDADNCDGELIARPGHAAEFCSELYPTGLLAKYSQQRALHGDAWSVFSVSTVDAKTWKIGVVFSEDGRISPGVSLSGHINRFTENSDHGVRIDDSDDYATRATVLVNWRMRFNIDATNSPDHVEEFNFTLKPDSRNRRTMQVRTLQTETLRKVDREQFRGWRIRDALGPGYYLDPQTSGFTYRNSELNWTQFDLAVSRDNACEQHAQGNVSDLADCGKHLDDFVNGESLESAAPVLWFNLTRVWHPRPEDLPAIATVDIRFDLIPFDWTSSSPFEVFDD